MVANLRERADQQIEPLFASDPAGIENLFPPRPTRRLAQLREGRGQRVRNDLDPLGDRRRLAQHRIGDRARDRLQAVRPPVERHLAFWKACDADVNFARATARNDERKKDAVGDGHVGRRQYAAHPRGVSDVEQTIEQLRSRRVGRWHAQVTDAVARLLAGQLTELA